MNFFGGKAEWIQLGHGQWIRYTDSTFIFLNCCFDFFHFSFLIVYSTRGMVAQECTHLVQELIITPQGPVHIPEVSIFDLFDSMLRIFHCFWCKFESIFLVRPSFLWTHIPQLTFRSSRCAALAPQFALHSSPTVGWVIFFTFFGVVIHWSIF